MNKLRHVGKLINTDQRCVIAFMQIPKREDHALVILTDALPMRYEQAVMDTLKSVEAQNEECLAMVLGRRIMPDSGRDILSTLHLSGMLMAVPCNNVMMLPMPNQPIRLTEILVSLGRLRIDENATQRDKFNAHANNMEASNKEGTLAIAHNLIYAAKLLEDEATKKRELAYSYAPQLRPIATVSIASPLEDRMSADIVPPSSMVHDPDQLSLDALLRD